MKDQTSEIPILASLAESEDRLANTANAMDVTLKMRVSPSTDRDAAAIIGVPFDKFTLVSRFLRVKDSMSAEQRDFMTDMSDFATAIATAVARHPDSRDLESAVASMDKVIDLQMRGGLAQIFTAHHGSLDVMAYIQTGALMHRQARTMLTDYFNVGPEEAKRHFDLDYGAAVALGAMEILAQQPE